VLYRLGVRLVCYDRPGYGGSDRLPDRTVADAAADIEAIADRLGIERFAVVGRSGGGPHALAAAALMPERVWRTVVLVGLAPPDAQDLDWFHGMTEVNVREYTTADIDGMKLVERLRLLSDRARRDPDGMVDLLRSQMTGPDLRVVGDLAIRRLLVETYLEAFRHGPYGWIDDVLALRSDWGFRPEAVGTPVLLWHGADDNFSPAAHTRWLAARIPGAEAIVAAGTAHFGAVQVLPELLAWLVGARPGPPGLGGR
jgi:pimeloyl-ACP methyl ester carboxylesterase